MRRNEVTKLAIVLLLLALPGAAGTLTGVVRNGTTGAPVAGQEVVLLALQGGMEAVATTKTDAQGRFRFDHPSLGSAPLLVRAAYRGVNYHQNVPPGRTAVDLEVFDGTQDPRAFQVASRFLVLQPNGPVLVVGEEFVIQNATQPPVAFFKPEGTFEFIVPEDAQLGQVSAWGASGMPLVQGTIDKGGNRRAIAFPLRPGQNGVRVAYEVPYGNNRATLRVSSPYPAQRMFLVAPPQLAVTGTGFQPAGREQGMSLYVRDSVPAATLEISVSGTAPLPAESLAEPTAPAGSLGAVSAHPARLDSLKWVLIAGFAALFALGGLYLWRKPSLATSPREPIERDIARQVEHSLDEIKERLFRLELRRQAGTISEEEYAREHSRAQKILRDLVRG